MQRLAKCKSVFVMEWIKTLGSSAPFSSDAVGAHHVSPSVPKIRHLLARLGMRVAL